MRKYSEFVAEAGPCPQVIPAEYEWLAYKAGQCKIFNSKLDAENFSKLIECRCTNEIERQNRIDEIKAHRRNLHDCWFSELRKSKSSIPDPVFNLFYDQACILDNDMQYGPDAIADHLDTLVEFYNKVYAVWEELV